MVPSKYDKRLESPKPGAHSMSTDYTPMLSLEYSSESKSKGLFFPSPQILSEIEETKTEDFNFLSQISSPSHPLRSAQRPTENQNRDDVVYSQDTTQSNFMILRRKQNACVKEVTLVDDVIRAFFTELNGEEE